MKIESTTATGQVETTRSVGPRVTAEKAENRATDQVAISKQASELRHIAFAAAPELKGATASRVAELKEHFKRGSLKADHGAIADKMLAEID